MKKYWIVIFLIVFVPVLSTAQEDQKNEAQGYAFVGLGDTLDSTAVHFGGGGEVDFYKGLGFGIDLGYMAATRNLSGGIGILSFDGRYAFRRFADSKLIPYVTGGYSFLFRTDTANAVNFGGGVDYWFADKYGLKLEFRDHLITDCYSNCHAYQFRGGVSFR
ncbi:MAG: outer membrane beta-barrel protein [Acidobacteriota bacterium]